MNKKEYILTAIQNDLHLDRRWLLSIFGKLPVSTVPSGDYHLGTTDTGKLYTVVGSTTIELPSNEDGRLLTKSELVKLVSKDLPNVMADMETTYGRVIVNSLLFLYPYGDRVPYQNNKITGKIANAVATDMLFTDKATVDEHIKFENAASMLTCLTQVGVPSASRKSVTPNPDFAKFKKSLLEKYKGQLDDPLIVAKIQEAIIAEDRKYLSGDSSTGFLISDKAFKRARMRTSGMFGVEPDFTDETKLNIIFNSLREGWDVKDLDALVNTTRAASYARGASTALGGAKVKVSSRIFHNFSMVDEDCQTTAGLKVLITQENAIEYVGRTLVGGSKVMTLEDLTGKIGKTLNLRSPFYCKSSGTTICRVCIGETVFTSGLGLSSLTTTMTSSFLNLFMAMTHAGGGVSVHAYDYNERIR